MRHTRLVRAAVRPAVDLRRLQPVLEPAGLTAWPTAPRHSAAPPASSSTAAPPPTVSIDPTDCLAPLFSSDFVYEEHQYSSLGDAVVARVVADSVFGFCSHRQLAVTPNVAKQLAAVFHNHHAMRYHAERLGFSELATSAVGGVDAGSAAEVVAALAVPTVGPRGVDLRGTSFEFAPHHFAPSPLGSKLSHFIGCVQIHMGPEAAQHAVRNVWQLSGAADDGDVHGVTANVPHSAVTLLSRLVERYPTGSVALSILAAQGVTAQFSSRTIMAAIDLAPPSQEPRHYNGVAGGQNGGGGGAAAAPARHSTGNTDGPPPAPK